MGSKGSKTKDKNSQVPAKKPVLTSKDIKFFVSNTGFSEEQVTTIFNEFSQNNPDGTLDKNEFVKMYTLLRPEAVDRLDEICAQIFRAFDSDNNGFVTFNEFLIGYALTSRGDMRTKLQYAFELYDCDNNGYLNKGEVAQVISAMLDLYGADKQCHVPSQIAHECVENLDGNNDDQLNKEEFIQGLMGHYELRSLMSPFC